MPFVCLSSGQLNLPWTAVAERQDASETPRDAFLWNHNHFLEQAQTVLAAMVQPEHFAAAGLSR